jgi:hypothetical protein
MKQQKLFTAEEIENNRKEWEEYFGEDEDDDMPF